MTKCRGCGAAMHFIKMTSGKMMPCDGERLQGDGKRTLITPEGTMVAKADGEVFGYVPHFATCPKARLFERRTSIKNIKAKGGQDADAK